MTQTGTRKTRAERLAMPLAREVVKDLAVEHGACIRPLQLRRTDLETGAVDQVLLPCGHTLARCVSGLRPAGQDPPRGPGRHRTNRRRQDAAPLPRRKIAARTVGKTYTSPDGETFRPSMFLTLTCPSYGRVREDGTPADPDAYDYTRAARDALHFAALFDRFVQNLRRFLGYDVQYFAAVESQRRLAPPAGPAIAATNGNRG